MPTARLVEVRAKQGTEAEVARIMRELGDWLSKQKGFLGNLGLVAVEVEDSPDIVGIIFWETREDGDRAAMTARALALMSELKLVAGEEHIRSEYYAVTEQGAGLLRAAEKG